MMIKRDIFVYASRSAMTEPEVMGTLSMVFLKGKEKYSFAYHADWLKGKANPKLGPDIPLAHGKSYPTTGQTIFGIFADASPDRWGRMLMMRREKIAARKEGRPEKTLMELDFLLGVDDSGRMGALRFKESLDGSFLADDRNSPVPPLADLRKLESAALRLDRDDSDKVDDAIEMLFRPGGSLGGARPKANVRDAGGSLWIAKFPSENDEIDVGGWEEVTATLARAAGINMSESKAIKLASKHHTFLTKRFDRTGSGVRHLYASAMTLLGKKDGDSSEASYLDIAELLISQGGTPKIQLEELWRRIVFSILVSNTDDHLRNHGFLYNFENRGWDLSPAFDINPSRGGKGLSISIDETDNSLALDLALGVAPYFNLEQNEAKEILDHVLRIRSGWRLSAKRIGIKPSEIDVMAGLFEASR
jgi:serine/threonine-protein kinase HipA